MTWRNDYILHETIDVIIWSCRGPTSYSEERTVFDVLFFHYNYGRDMKNTDLKNKSMFLFC